MRVRNFTQDDAHIFLTEDQIIDEILRVIDFINAMYAVFGFEYAVELSTRPEESIGTEEQWEIATQALKDALDKKGLSYKINEGDGAFYGPKIDFHLRDSINRTWQCGTVQLDFQMPERFDLSYVGSDGQKHRPIVIHRVIYGSIERFIAILTEHFAGEFPLWLAPVQIGILSVNEAFNDYAYELKEIFGKSNFRVEVDERNEKLSYKIREAELAKYPYTFVVGGKEKESRTITVRSKKKKGEIGNFEIEKVLRMFESEVELKSY
jgi:threonyl-tRNA synthetase